MKRARYLPSICLFRQRFLYAIGGINHSESKPHKSAKWVSQIERLDVREGAEWEIIQIKAEFTHKIQGHSLSSLQISASEILIFGSYFKKLEPTYGEMMFYVYDHEKGTLKVVTNYKDEY
jgi:hypothetical protein